MKAMLMTDIGALEYSDVPKPDPGDGGLLVRVESCAICATDIKLLEYGHSAITLPHVLGHEMAGTVAGVSGEAGGFRPGDRAALAPTLSCNSCWLCEMGAYTQCEGRKTFGYHWWGGFAEYAAVPKEAVEGGLVKRIPDGVDFDAAAVAEPLACAMHGQNEVDTRPGDTVVVLGLGPLGCMHIAVARARGARKIIASDIRESRIDLARRFAADVYVDQTKENLREVVAAETSGRGASVVIAATPAKEAVALAVELVAPRGRVSIFGGLPSSDPVVPIDVNIIHYKEATMHGSFSASPADCDLAMALIASGSFDAGAVVTHRVPLPEVGRGMDLIRRGESLKVIVKPQAGGL